MMRSSASCAVPEAVGGELRQAQGAGPDDGVEDRVVELDRVGGDVEVGDRIDVGRAERGVEEERIRTASTGQRVQARPAVELVLAGVADDRVGERIAGAVDIGGARQGQVLDLLAAEVEADRAADQVDAGVAQFDDGNAGTVDDVGVVVGGARQGVGTAFAASERVLAGVAGHGVVEGVAGPVDVGRAGQHQVLEIGHQRAGDRRLDRIGAFAEGFDDDVIRPVDDIGVVAQSAEQGVDSTTAIEHVVAGVASQVVAQRVAGSVDIGGAGQRDVVSELAHQAEAHRASDCVRAGIACFDHLVAGIVHDVDVIAGAALHDVGAGAAVQGVLIGVAEKVPAGRRYGSCQRERAAGTVVVRRVHPRREGPGVDGRRSVLRHAARRLKDQAGGCRDIGFHRDVAAAPHLEVCGRGCQRTDHHNVAGCRASHDQSAGVDPVEFGVRKFEGGRAVAGGSEIDSPACRRGGNGHCSAVNGRNAGVGLHSQAVRVDHHAPPRGWKRRGAPSLPTAGALRLCRSSGPRFRLPWRP
jgi:hypothetical protein